MGPFSGIVVEKNEGIQSDGQGSRDRLQVAGLVRPICLQHGDVTRSDQEFGMVLERTECGLMIILGRDGQHHSPVP